MMRRSPACILFGRMLFVAVVWNLAVAEGATNIWDGGGIDNYWSTGENWIPDGGVPASASNTTVQLDGPSRLSSVQNISNPFILNRLDILNGPGAGAKSPFVLSGGQLQFALDGATQPRITSPHEAVSTISNNIDIANGITLNVECITYGVTLSGVISGGGSIDKLQNPGEIGLGNSANSFSGGLTFRGIDSDWYRANVYASHAMGTGPVNLYGGTLSTNFINPGGLRLYNTTSHDNPVNLFAHSPIYVIGDVTLNGNIDLNSFCLTLRGGGTGTISGIISEGATNALIKVDSGTWILSGGNTLTGTVTVNTGTLTVNGAVNAGIVVKDGAILNGSGTLNWHVGEKVEVAGTLNISQLHLNLQVPESEREEFIIVDYNLGSLVGAAFASVVGKPRNCQLIYDSTNKLVVLKSYNKGTVFAIQ